MLAPEKFTFAYKTRGIHLRVKNSTSCTEEDKSDFKSSHAYKPTQVEGGPHVFQKNKAMDFKS